MEYLRIGFCLLVTSVRKLPPIINRLTGKPFAFARGFTEEAKIDGHLRNFNVYSIRRLPLSEGTDGPVTLSLGVMDND